MLCAHGKRGCSAVGAREDGATNFYAQRVVENLEAARIDSLRAVQEVRRSEVGRHHTLPNGHEWIELAPLNDGVPRALYATLITRVDYRENASKPLTEQRAGDKWDKRKRQQPGALSAVMAIETVTASIEEDV